MSAATVNCPVCGRFMRRGGYYTNDHYDSWENTYKCTQNHRRGGEHSLDENA